MQETLQDWRLSEEVLKLFPKATVNLWHVWCACVCVGEGFGATEGTVACCPHSETREPGPTAPKSRQ